MQDPNPFLTFLLEGGYNPRIIADGCVGGQGLFGADAWEASLGEVDAKEIDLAIKALKEGGFGPPDLQPDGDWGPRATLALAEFRALALPPQEVEPPASSLELIDGAEDEHEPPVED